MILKSPTNEKELVRLLKQGEGPTLEFKRSTGELREGMQTICAFLNGSGGIVIFGVRPDGAAAGQEVSDQTLREIAQASDRFSPSINPSIRRIKFKTGREVVAVSVEGGLDAKPFTYDGRGYERVGSTTRRMTQVRYEKVLLDRAHGKRRWENEPAEGVELRDIDREEVFRIVEAAKSEGRLIGSVGNRVADVLDRLKLRRDGRILQAAVVLFGKEFLPDYPQCELRMARFRGKDKTEFLDQRQIRAPAFKLLEEAELFCQRHFPLPGKIVSGKLQRVDTPLIPPDAMREILVNAIVHRDYSVAGGAISLAVFDDRVEVWSAGTYPTGITPDMLSRDHQSVQRNPIIADVFFRAGLIEKWGRGTNRVIDMCKAAGVPLPEFEEISGAAVVRFRVNVLGPQKVAGVEEVKIRDQVVIKLQPESQPELQPESLGDRVLRLLKAGPLSKAELSARLGQKGVSGQLNKVIRSLLAKRQIEYTIPDKPNSRLQKYRLKTSG
jgi:ATP-dependent DNA helicase RecG